MPKLVDHAERRDQIVEVAIAALIGGGWSAVSLRGVASAGGWSLGSVRHYFPDHASLQSAVAVAIAERLHRDVGTRIGHSPTGRSAVEHVVDVVEQVLPLDHIRRDEYALWEALVEWERDHAHVEPTSIWEDQRQLYRRCISYLAPPDTDHADIDRWAAFLHVFADGLASQMVLTPAHVAAPEVRVLVNEFVRSAETALSRS